MNELVEVSVVHHPKTFPEGALKGLSSSIIWVPYLNFSTNVLSPSWKVIVSVPRASQVSYLSPK